MSGTLTLDALKEVPEGELVNFLWEFHRDQMQRANLRSLDDWRRFNLDFPRGIQVFESVDSFHGEIINSGLRQYICNFTDSPDALNQLNEAVEALRTIEATESADILRQVIDVHTRDGWPSAPRDNWYEGLSPDDEALLDRLEDILFETKAAERDYELLERYLREHLSECVVLRSDDG